MGKGGACVSLIKCHHLLFFLHASLIAWMVDLRLEQFLAGFFNLRESRALCGLCALNWKSERKEGGNKFVPCVLAFP